MKIDGMVRGAKQGPDNLNVKRKKKKNDDSDFDSDDS